MVKQPSVILPLGFDLNKSYALQRLMEDTKHREALDYIIYNLAGTYDDPTDASNTHLTYRNIGRASVGRAIVTISKLKLDMVKKSLEATQKQKATRA